METAVFTSRTSPRLALTFWGGVTERTLFCAIQLGRNKAAKKASRGAFLSNSLGPHDLLDSIFKIILARQPDVCGDDPAIAVDQERGRQRVHAAVQLGSGVITLHNPVVDCQFGDEGLDHRPSLFIHGYTDYSETLVFVLSLELNEPRDLDFT